MFCIIGRFTIIKLTSLSTIHVFLVLKLEQERKMATPRRQISSEIIIITSCHVRILILRLSIKSSYVIILFSDYYRPSSRYQQFTTIVGNYLYMWGGDAYIFPEEHDTPAKIGLISVVEILDLTSGKWEQKRTRGTPPLGIIGYVSTAIESNVIYFGGYCNHDRCYHNNLKILDIDSLAWRDIMPSNPNQSPMKRGYGGIAALKVNQQDYLLIIGGRGPCPKTRQCDAQYYKLQNGMYRTNETHLYDFRTSK